MSKVNFRVVIAALWALGISGHTLADMPIGPPPMTTSVDPRPAVITRKIENRPAPMIETGLRFAYMSYLPFGFGIWWINNDSFIVNVWQDVPNAERLEKRRVMLVDSWTGQSKTILADGQMAHYEAEFGAAIFAPSPYRRDRNREDEIHTYRVDAEGHLGPIPEGLPLNPKTLERTDLPPGGSTKVMPLRKQDGYIQRSTSAKGFDDYEIAYLIRPDAPPRSLGVESGEIQMARYLAYFDQYLLNDLESQHNSGTDKRLGGAGWKRPYDLTPYRLMSPDGRIDEIPYPKIIFEFGLSGFHAVLPTPHGLLIDHAGNKDAPNEKPQGLVLLKGERMTRIWGGHAWLDKDRYRAVRTWSMSPDGCRLAFVHTAEWRLFGSHTLSILNLCKDN